MGKLEILLDRRILAVGYPEDVLRVISKELSVARANVTLHAAATFEEAYLYLLYRYTYDLVFLDIESVLRAFDLLQIIRNVGIPTVMLTARAFTPEDLRKSLEMGATTYLPSDTVGSLIPVLEDVLELNHQKEAMGEYWMEFETRPAFCEAALLSDTAISRSWEIYAQRVLESQSKKRFSAKQMSWPNKQLREANNDNSEWHQRTGGGRQETRHLAGRGLRSSVGIPGQWGTAQAIPG